MKAYYGFKVQGAAAEYLEQFKDFQWIPNVQNTGFLGIEINSTEDVEKTINFPKMLDNYLMVANLSVLPNKNLLKDLNLYKNEEKQPIIFMPLGFKNKYFETWQDYSAFQESKHSKLSP